MQNKFNKWEYFISRGYILPYTAEHIIFQHILNVKYATIKFVLTSLFHLSYYFFFVILLIGFILLYVKTKLWTKETIKIGSMDNSEYMTP